MYDMFLFSVLQVSGKETSKPSIFTFVPVVQKLPIKSIIAEEERTGALTEKADKVLQQHTHQMIN